LVSSIDTTHFRCTIERWFVAVSASYPVYPELLRGLKPGDMVDTPSAKLASGIGGIPSCIDAGIDYGPPRDIYVLPEDTL